MLDRDWIGRRYERVRARTEALAAPLSAEDSMVQSIPDASPTKWHLAHTTWFFEEFVLSAFDRSHRWPDVRWRALFNSYYDAVGGRPARSVRAVLSRPSLAEVLGWRRSLDTRMLEFLAKADDAALAAALVGTHHEEQHQELILTDAKHALSSNPLSPAYAPASEARRVSPTETTDALAWIAFDERVVDIGGSGASFAFDNEMPRHRELVSAFTLASRLVTNTEYAAFVDDRGYERPELWLSDGWVALQSNGWRAPLYWQRIGGEWFNFGFRGLGALDSDVAVCHISFFEADAYARWAGARLPTEQEWESVAREVPLEGNFLDSGALAPVRAAGRNVTQLFGDAWEWTGSAYRPYPRFRPLQGELGEYNGKFMSGQMVLRGGSCLSPQEHLRASYRNYFPPPTRWQMTGIRLARDS